MIELMQLLINRLDQGVFLDNLHEMISLCRKLVFHPDLGLAFYVVEHVLADIVSAWDERPVSVDEAEFAQKRLLIPIRQLVVDLQGEGITPGELKSRLDSIVKASLDTVPVLKAHKYI